MRTPHPVLRFMPDYVHDDSIDIHISAPNPATGGKRIYYGVLHLDGLFHWGSSSTEPTLTSEGTWSFGPGIDAQRHDDYWGRRHIQGRWVTFLGPDNLALHSTAPSHRFGMTLRQFTRQRMYRGMRGSGIIVQGDTRLVMAQVFRRNDTYLLPQAYPEGSPLHPSYGAGHATVPGACVTMLKALFDESFVIPNPVVPTPDGLMLVPYNSPPLTVGGELNKPASNISFGRNFAGIHWRTDAAESWKLGRQ